MEPKHVLVVCSSLIGIDFNNLLNIKVKELFGDNPVYTFCDGKINKFPTFPISNDKVYDFIWFAGCNILSHLFLNFDLTTTKIKNILKEGGIILFTESKEYKMKYIKREPNTLTIPIAILLLHQDRLIDTNDAYELFKKNLLTFFNENFTMTLINDLFLYKCKEKSGLKKYLKYKKKYLQLKNKNFNL